MARRIINSAGEAPSPLQLLGEVEAATQRAAESLFHLATLLRHSNALPPAAAQENVPELKVRLLEYAAAVSAIDDLNHKFSGLPFREDHLRHRAGALAIISLAVREYGDRFFEQNDPAIDALVDAAE